MHATWGVEPNSNQISAQDCPEDPKQSSIYKLPLEIWMHIARQFDPVPVKYIILPLVQTSKHFYRMFKVLRYPAIRLDSPDNIVRAKSFFQKEKGAAAFLKKIEFLVESEAFQSDQKVYHDADSPELEPIFKHLKQRLSRLPNVQELSFSYWTFKKDVCNRIWDTFLQGLDKLDVIVLEEEPYNQLRSYIKRKPSTLSRLQKLKKIKVHLYVGDEVDLCTFSMDEWSEEWYEEYDGVLKPWVTVPVKQVKDNFQQGDTDALKLIYSTKVEFDFEYLPCVQEETWFPYHLVAGMFEGPKGQVILHCAPKLCGRARCLAIREKFIPDGRLEQW